MSPPQPGTHWHAPLVVVSISNFLVLVTHDDHGPASVLSSTFRDLFRRITPRAVGWRIEVLDSLGELSSHVLCEPEPTGTGSTELAPDRGANKWHSVVVLGRSSVAIGGGQQGHDAVSAEALEGRDAATATGMGKSGGHATGDRASAQAKDDSVGIDSESSVFEVKFESGTTADLDLSHFSIRWISFVGPVQGGVICHDGGHANANGVADRNGDDGLPPTRPPGFETMEDLSGPLANSQADVGTRVDVWWPRYNSYFRATVSNSGCALRTGASNASPCHYTKGGGSV